MKVGIGVQLDFRSVKSVLMLLTEGKKLHPPFFACFERLVGKTNGKIIPFVAHNMIIHKPIMLELLDRIEKRFDKKWFDAILDNIDYSQNSFFSEYQTYGNYLINYHPNRVSIRRLAWSESLKPKAALNILLGRLHYFALHSYKKQPNPISFFLTQKILKIMTGKNNKGPA